jgi:hypothetical protein
MRVRAARMIVIDGVKGAWIDRTAQHTLTRHASECRMNGRLRYFRNGFWNAL